MRSLTAVKQLRLVLAAAGAVPLALAASMPESAGAGGIQVVFQGRACQVTTPNGTYVGSGGRIGARPPAVHYICQAGLVDGTAVDRPTGLFPYENLGTCQTADGLLGATVFELPGGHAQAFCSNEFPPQ